MIRPDDIRELLRKQPFQPFRMHLSNGQSYDVTHPELAMVTQGTIVVSKPIPNSDVPYGRGIHLVSVLHINNVEILPAQAESKTA